MKRIAIIALSLVLAAGIMTGCRRNDMQDTGNTGDTGVTILPTASSRPGDNGVGTDPMDGSSGNEDAIPRGRVHGSGR